MLTSLHYNYPFQSHDDLWLCSPSDGDPHIFEPGTHPSEPVLAILPLITLAVPAGCMGAAGASFNMNSRQSATRCRLHCPQLCTLGPSIHPRVCL